MEIISQLSIVDALRQHAQHQPERTAFTFLRDGINPKDSLTYAELDRRARALAALLQASVPAGERVMLCFAEGTEFVVALFGCLYAGMVAVPAPPADTTRIKRSLARLHAIHSNAAPALLLGVAPSDLLSTAFEGATWAYTSEIDEQQGCDWQPPFIGGNDLAYLQYTSGSMSTPKGVMIRHRNLMHNLQELQDILPYGPDGAVASWMPNFHDYGLVEGILRPIYAGVPSYLSSPRAFLKRPGSWLEAISRYRVTHSGAAAFAYQYCVQKTAMDELTGVDLSCWQVATVGAEPVRPQTLQAFADRFASAGFRFESFYPGYGLAELTLCATGYTNGGLNASAPTIFQDQQGRSLIGCGRTSDTTTLIVVDPETRMRVPDAVAGEMWITGPSVAAGYWNQPEETCATFNAFLADTGEGPFLRSGDIGFLREGELFITGRHKNMIIIHGENYYAEEIEWIAQQAHPRIQHHASAVFAVPGKHTEQVVVVHEIDRVVAGSLDPDAVLVAIRRSVVEYFGIPIHGVTLVKRGTIPRTSSGKIQRHQCRDAYLDGTLVCIASWKLDEQTALLPEPMVEGVEAVLLRIWQNVLDVSVVTTTSNFFDMGGDSLVALQLIHAVEEQFGQSIPGGFWEQPTIGYLAYLLQDDQDQVPAGSSPVPKEPRRRQLSASLSSRITGMLAEVRRIVRDRLRDLRSLTERPAFLLPYPLGRRWLATWVGLPGVEALVYRRERRLVRGFLACLNSSKASERKVLQAVLTARSIAIKLQTLLTDCDLGDIAAYISTLDAAGRFWEPFAQAARAATWNEPVRTSVFSNLAMLQQIDRGHGVILITYHNPYNTLAMLALLSLKFNSIFVLRREHIAATSRTLVRTREDEEADAISASAIATHIQLAHSCLRDGGIVVIAGDGALGQGSSVRLPVHGRWFPFKTGFAELALHTGAVVVPMAVSSGLVESLRITFHTPLDPGDESMPHAERVHSLVKQYADFFQYAVGEAPETLSLEVMKSFLKHEQVVDAASSMS